MIYTNVSGNIRSADETFENGEQEIPDEGAIANETLDFIDIDLFSIFLRNGTRHDS